MKTCQGCKTKFDYEYISTCDYCNKGYCEQCADDALLECKWGDVCRECFKQIQ